MDAGVVDIVVAAVDVGDDVVETAELVDPSVNISVVTAGDTSLSDVDVAAGIEL